MKRQQFGGGSAPLCLLVTLAATLLLSGPHTLTFTSAGLSLGSPPAQIQTRTKALQPAVSQP